MVDRVTERTDGVTTERTEETDTGGTTVVERRGGGGGVLIGIAALILVLLIGYFVLNATRNDNAKTNAVTSAAGSVSDTAKKAGDAVGGDSSK